MKVITRHEADTYTQVEVYQNVVMVRMENQEENGWWLILTFKTGSKEDLDLPPTNNHELDIGWEIDEDIFEVIEWWKRH